MDKSTLDQILENKKPDESGRTAQGGESVSASHQDSLIDRSAADSAQIEAEVIELFSQHAAALSRYAERLTHNSTLVEDGVQEAFLRYFKTRSSGQQVEKPRAWLFRVTRNYIMDCVREAGTMRPVILENAENVEDVRQRIGVEYEQSEIFKRALSVLSPRERECMLLRLEGLGYEEIANVLRIRSGTVGALLARGLKKIRNAGVLL